MPPFHYFCGESVIFIYMPPPPPPLSTAGHTQKGSSELAELLKVCSLSPAALHLTAPCGIPSVAPCNISNCQKQPKLTVVLVLCLAAVILGLAGIKHKEHPVTSLQDETTDLVFFWEGVGGAFWLQTNVFHVKLYEGVFCFARSRNTIFFFQELFLESYLGFISRPQIKVLMQLLFSLDDDFAHSEICTRTLRTAVM